MLVAYSFIPLIKMYGSFISAQINLTFTANNFKSHTATFMPSSRANPDIPCSDHVGKHTCRMSVSIRVSDKDLIEGKMNTPEYELTLTHVLYNIRLSKHQLNPITLLFNVYAEKQNNRISKVGLPFHYCLYL